MRTAETTAEALWQVGAISIRAERKFQLPHAAPSPLFIDTRLLFSAPSVRRVVVAGLVRRIGIEARASPELIVGDETAGIPLAAWVAEEVGVGMLYVRKSPKAHGLANLVEGGSPTGKNVVVVTDLVNVGTTLAGGVAALIAGGAALEQVVTVVKRAPIADYQPFASMGVRMHHLVTVEELLEVGHRREFITTANYRRVLAYLADASAEAVYRAQAGSERQPC